EALSESASCSYLAARGGRARTRSRAREFRARSVRSFAGGRPILRRAEPRCRRQLQVRALALAEDQRDPLVITARRTARSEPQAVAGSGAGSAGGGGAAALPE